MAPTRTPKFGILFLDCFVDWAQLSHECAVARAHAHLTSTLGEPDVERIYDVDAVELQLFCNLHRHTRCENVHLRALSCWIR